MCLHVYTYLYSRTLLIEKETQPNIINKCYVILQPSFFFFFGRADSITEGSRVPNSAVSGQNLGPHLGNAASKRYQQYVYPASPASSLSETPFSRSRFWICRLPPTL